SQHFTNSSKKKTRSFAIAKPSTITCRFAFRRYGVTRDLLSLPTRRSSDLARTCPPRGDIGRGAAAGRLDSPVPLGWHRDVGPQQIGKSTRLNSSHVSISYAVFCLKKKKEEGFARNSRGPNRERHSSHRQAT